MHISNEPTRITALSFIVFSFLQSIYHIIVPIFVNYIHRHEIITQIV